MEPIKESLPIIWRDFANENYHCATGARWRELNIPGEKEKLLEKGLHIVLIAMAPFLKNKEVAVVGGGNSGVEAALDLSGIVRKVSLIEFMPNLKADQILIDKSKTI